MTNGNGKREYVAFQNNAPEKVALAFPDGLTKDFGYGLKTLYTLTDGRAMVLDPEVAQKIRLAQVQPGQEFWLCKRRKAGKGAKPLWDLYLDDPTPRGQESPLERDLRLSVSYVRQEAASSRPTAPPTGRPNITTATQIEPSTSSTVTRQDSSPAAPALPTPRPMSIAGSQRPGWASTLEQQATHLIDVYAALIAHATTQHHGLVKPEDVRALLTTTFINLSQKGRTNAA